MLKNVKIFEIGPCLDLPVCDQSFSMYACMCTIVIAMNLLRLIFSFILIISSTIIFGKVFAFKYILMNANLYKILEIYHHIECSEKVSSYHELFEQKLHKQTLKTKQIPYDTLIFIFHQSLHHISSIKICFLSRKLSEKMKFDTVLKYFVNNFFS